MAWDPFAGMTYDQVMHAARSRLDADEMRRGADHLFWARRLRGDLERHQPAAKAAGDPCSECGARWPCDTLRFIVSPD